MILNSKYNIMYKQIKEKMSDGKIMLREYKTYNNGKNWERSSKKMLPQTSDVDWVLYSKKYPDKTIKEILGIDREYLKTIVRESYLPPKVRKAIIRVLINEEDVYIAYTNDNKIHYQEKSFVYYDVIAEQYAVKNNIIIK